MLRFAVRLGKALHRWRTRLADRVDAATAGRPGHHPVRIGGHLLAAAGAAALFVLPSAVVEYGRHTEDGDADAVARLVDRVELVATPLLAPLAAAVGLATALLGGVVWVLYLLAWVPVATVAVAGRRFLAGRREPTDGTGDGGPGGDDGSDADPAVPSGGPTAAGSSSAVPAASHVDQPSDATPAPTDGDAPAESEAFLASDEGLEAVVRANVGVATDHLASGRPGTAAVRFVWGALVALLGVVAYGLGVGIVLGVLVGVTGVLLGFVLGPWVVASPVYAWTLRVVVGVPFLVFAVRFAVLYGRALGR